jgi:hypothetical protein
MAPFTDLPQLAWIFVAIYDSRGKVLEQLLINLKFDSPIGNGPAEAQNQHF